MTAVTVTVAVDDGVAAITLARPDRLNALDVALAEELTAALRGPAADAEVIVLAATGRAFCAGGDIQAMVDSGDPGGYVRTLTDRLNAALLAIAEHPAVVIASVQGAVAGGGIGLVLASDIAIASSAATFTPAYGAVGLTPDCGVSFLLPSAIGTARARRFLLTGERIGAKTAEEWGLVADVVEPHALDDRIRHVTNAVGKAGRSASGATKRLLRTSRRDYRRQLEHEADEIVRQAGCEPARSRLAAFASRS